MRAVEIDFIRIQIVKDLAKPILVVKIKPVTESLTRFRTCVKGVEVDVGLVESPPQPLFENIFLTPAPTVHANGDAVFF